VMESGVLEAVKKSLISCLGETKVLWKKPDIVLYRKDTYRIKFDEDYKYLPDLVVLPETTAEVQEIVKVAAERRIPLIPKGGGSSRTGMLVPIHGGILVDTIKMNRVIEVSVPNLYVTVQPGVTLKELEEHLSEHNLALNQEQGSLRMATVGGSISTSGFSRKHQKYGTIADRVMSLEVVLADGRILRTGPKVLYTSTGYRLHQLFVGAEGTLGIITEATLRVEPLPEAKDAIVAFYKGFWEANEAAQRIMSSGVTFTGGEAYEGHDMSSYGAPPGLNGLFYVGFEGIKGEVEAEVEFVKKIVADTGGVLATHENASRFMGMYSEQWCGARTRTKSEDVLTTYVPMERMVEFYDILWNKIGKKYGISPLPGEKYGLDVGRYRIVAGRFFLPKGEGAYEKYQSALREIAELATGMGGSVSSCHGVGIQHKESIKLEYSEIALETMRAIKRTLDPDNIMNPGKKIDA